MKKSATITVRPLVFLIPCLILLSPACTPSLEDKVRTYEQAHNDHDIEKVMSMYANDARFEIVGSWVRTGKEEIHGLAEWDSVTNSHMIITDINVMGDTVSFKLKEGNDWFRLIGIEFMYYDPCRMVFDNGLLTELRAETTMESMKAFQEKWPPLYQWLSTEKSEELSSLVSNGEFIYNAEKAEKWVSLLREWGEEREE